MRLIIGVDEAGFGSIAGPLVVCAVAFRSTTRHPQIRKGVNGAKKTLVLRDSKRVSGKNLELLHQLVIDTCVGYEIAERPAWEIDQETASRIRENTMILAIRRLIERLSLSYPQGVYGDYQIFIDGELDLGGVNFKYRAIPQADRDIWQVSAASIVAKKRQVERMLGLHDLCNQYGWDRNKGYATADHLAAIAQHGATRYHRKSYRAVKELL